MAGLTLARKMAAITLTIWKKGEDFDTKQLQGQAALSDGRAIGLGWSVESVHQYSRFQPLGRSLTDFESPSQVQKPARQTNLKPLNDPPASFATPAPLHPEPASRV
jgi:hypothetical protein